MTETNPTTNPDRSSAQAAWSDLSDRVPRLIETLPDDGLLIELGASIGSLRSEVRAIETARRSGGTQ